MIQHLRVGPHKALLETALTGLGTITVVCGKNNSGKTTLLEAINGQASRSEGRVIDATSLDRFFARPLGIRWPAYEERATEAYRQIIKAVFELRPIWFRDNEEFFATEVGTRYGNTPLLRQFNWGPTELRTAFAEEVGQGFTTILVPPKRNLEIRHQIATNAYIDSIGSGVLNYLFYSANQAPGSDDYQIYLQIRTRFESISAGYQFAIIPDKTNQIALSFSYSGGSLVPASDCGLGLQDLLVILYFAVHPTHDLVLIEEPESHLHPDVQRRLLLALREIPNKQYVLSTHSNVFLNSTLVDRVFFTTFEATVNVDDATSRAAILNDLGYSVTDNLVSDLVILVEGPTDTPVIEELLLKSGLYQTADIKTWPLGGDIMDQLDLRVLAEHSRLIAIIDNDSGSHTVRNRFRRRCEELGIPVHVLERYAIENYFNLRVLKEVFGAQIPDDVTSLDPDVPLEEQIHINVKRNNRRLAEQLTVADIEGTDLATFLEKVRQMLGTR